MTRAGVGYSDFHDSTEAGRVAAERALANAGVRDCDVVLAFSTSRHNPQQFLNGLRSVVGPKPQILGGGSVGIITNSHLSYGGFESGVAVLQSSTNRFEAFFETGFETIGSEFETGSRLGTQVRSRGLSETDSLLLMYDAIRGEPGQPFNMATPLLAGLNESFEGVWPRTSGMGLMGNMEFSPGHQWFNERVVNQSVLALGIRGTLQMDSVIIHGCKPASGYHTITDTDGPTILEIDGRPALEVVEEILGYPEIGWESYPLYITLGLNYGPKFGEFREENYANRLCMAIDRERKGLVMFEPDLQIGDEVQLMRRDINFEYVTKRAEQLMGRIQDREPVLALYIDCVGRASAYCGSVGEEAERIQSFFSRRIPLLGLYSGVEIAHIGERPQPLDWTGVLCVLSEAKRRS